MRGSGLPSPPERAATIRFVNSNPWTGARPVDRMITASVGVALFAIYALGAARTIYVGDSGELVTAVYLLGIPHPTSYPLYVLLGKLWTLLVPIGSIAFRMSLFSAAASASTCALLYALSRWLGLARWSALLAAGFLAWAPSFWAEANIQRVYALGALFVVAATWAALVWERRRTTMSFAAVALLCGLGATNHTFMLVFALAFAVFAIAADPRILTRGRDLGAATAAFALGVLPYLYLPLRARQHPALNWGDPETLDRFLAVVTRRGFWDRRWLERPADWIPITADFLRRFAVELTWGGAALAILGAIVAWRARKPVVRLALLAMVGNLLVMGLHGSRSDIFIWHRYDIPSYALAALLAAVGAQALGERLPPRWPALLLVLPLVNLVVGWHSFDRSRYRIAESYSRRVLAELPPGAHLAASDDNILFVLLYLYHVEGVRPDVDLIEQGVGGADLQKLHFDPDRDALFFTQNPNWNLPQLDVVPQDLAFRVVRRGTALPLANLQPRHLEGEDDPRVPRDYLTSNLIGEFHFMLGLNLERSDWTAAEGEYDRAAAAAPHNDVLFYNLGLVYERRGLLRKALVAFEHSAAINPRHLASSSRVLAADQVRALRARLGSGPP